MKSLETTELRSLQDLMDQSDEQLKKMKKGTEENGKLLNQITENINAQGNKNPAFNLTQPAYQTFEALDAKNFSNVYASSPQMADSTQLPLVQPGNNLLQLNPPNLNAFSPMLYVGDSIGHNVDFDYLRRETNCYITAVKAYGSEYESHETSIADLPRFPDQSFEDVVRAKLKGSPFRYLIMTGGSVDITNLRTKIQPKENLERYKRKINRSASKMFSTAVDALTEHKFLDKVILMERTPRADPKTEDPMGYKALLTEQANALYWTLWDRCDYKDKIIIGKHTFNSQTNDIYYRPRDNKYDGIHLFGPKGRTLFTESVFNAVYKANIVPSMPLQHMQPTLKLNPSFSSFSTANEANQKLQYFDQTYVSHGQVSGNSVSLFPSMTMQPLETMSTTFNANSLRVDNLANETLKESIAPIFGSLSNGSENGIKVEVKDTSATDSSTQAIVTTESTVSSVSESNETIIENKPICGGVNDESGRLQSVSTSTGLSTNSNPTAARTLAIQIPGVKLEPNTDDVLVTSDIIKNDNWLHLKKENQPSDEPDDTSSLALNVCLGTDEAIGITNKVSTAEQNTLTSPNDTSADTASSEYSPGHDKTLPKLNGNVEEKAGPQVHKKMHENQATNDKTEFLKHRETHGAMDVSNSRMYRCDYKTCSFASSKKKEIRKHREEVHQKLKKIREKIGDTKFKLSKFVKKSTSKPLARSDGASSDIARTAFENRLQNQSKEKISTPITPNVPNQLNDKESEVFKCGKPFDGEQDISGRPETIEGSRTDFQTVENQFEKEKAELRDNPHSSIIAPPLENLSIISSPFQDTHPTNSDQSPARSLEINDNSEDGGARSAKMSKLHKRNGASRRKTSVEKVAERLQRRRSSEEGIEEIISQDKEKIIFCIRFVRKVNETFRDCPDIVTSFHDLMQNYQQGQINQDILFSNITQLFSSNHELIDGFKIFIA